MTLTEAKPVVVPIDPYLKAFERFERAAATAQPAWLFPLRKAGLARFAELGFPTLKHEDWRFTNIAPIAKARPQACPKSTAVPRAARVTSGSGR